MITLYSSLSEHGSGIDLVYGPNAEVPCVYKCTVSFVMALSSWVYYRCILSGADALQNYLERYSNSCLSSGHSYCSDYLVNELLMVYSLTLCDYLLNIGTLNDCVVSQTEGCFCEHELPFISMRMCLPIYFRNIYIITHSHPTTILRISTTTSNCPSRPKN